MFKKQIRINDITLKKRLFIIVNKRDRIFLISINNNSLNPAFKLIFVFFLIKHFHISNK